MGENIAEGYTYKYNQVQKLKYMWRSRRKITRIGRRATAAWTSNVPSTGAVQVRVKRTYKVLPISDV